MDIRANVVDLTRILVQQQSISPDTSQAQDIINQRLSVMGFDTQVVTTPGRKNLWAMIGGQGPVFCFAGHTDVVPVGQESAWEFSPFSAIIEGDYIYGRGTEDMKGDLAAMIIAAESFVNSQGAPTNFRLAFLISGDEEHDSALGTEAILAWLKTQNIKIDYCVNGEPTSENQLGDVIKIGRRGSLQGRVSIYGKQGHSAHPQRADNAITKALPALTELSQLKFDDGDEYFQQTSLQITSIISGAGASNVIPGDLHARFNCRYSPALTAADIQTRVEAIFNKYALKAEFEWVNSATPFLTKPAFLSELVSAAIEAELGVKPKLTCTGGTSDARFIAAHGADVVEFGLHNETLHQVNERISIAELEGVTKVYLRVLQDLERSLGSSQ